MSPTGLGLWFSVVLFFLMLVFLEAGFRFGNSRSQSHQSAHEGVGTIEAAIFALVGLLLGFSFAGSMGRLDARRQLIINEANAIGTAYLRIDLLPPQAQPEMKQGFRDYLDSRLSTYKNLRSLSDTEQAIARTAIIQQTIWSHAVNASHSDPTQNIARLLLPALNEMFDVANARSVMLHTHLPSLIFVLMIFVALLSALVAGYAMSKRAQRSLLHMALYAAAIAVTIFAIIDLDYPRSGLIRLDAADNAMVQLRQSMK